ncbi:hypothetical protein [Lutimonas sp.]|uniref:hypothetical protein n=1 Tax=Lutimonas sp. TaxID=1872403 RepID=UPI003D9B6734
MLHSKKIWLLCLLMISFLLVQGQEQHSHEEGQDQSHHDKGHETHKKHVISASINHTVIFGGVKDGSASSLTLPSFGLNYTYFFNHKWAIGLHNDIILEDFVVKQNSTFETRSGDSGGEAETTVIERGTPVAACIMGIYKPLSWLGLMAGFGREFSSHEDFTVIRFGLEVPYHLPKNWELFGVLTYDINIDAYQSLTYGIGIGKLF